MFLVFKESRSESRWAFRQLRRGVAHRVSERHARAGPRHFELKGDGLGAQPSTQTLVEHSAQVLHQVAYRFDVRYYD